MIKQEWPRWRRVLSAVVLAVLLNHIIYSLGRLSGVDYTVMTPQGEQLLSAAQIAIFTALPMALGAGLFEVLARFAEEWKWKVFLTASAVAVAFSFIPFFQASYAIQTVLTLSITHLVPPVLLLYSVDKS